MSEPLCPTCGRIAAVWPSGILPGVKGQAPIETNALCAEFEFHGFTPGENGTIAMLYDGMEALAARLRCLARAKPPAYNHTREDSPLTPCLECR